MSVLTLEHSRVIYAAPILHGCCLQDMANDQNFAHTHLSEPLMYPSIYSFIKVLSIGRYDNYIYKHTHDGQQPISLSGIGKGYDQNMGTCHGHNHSPILTHNGLPFPRLFSAYPRLPLVHVLWRGNDRDMVRSGFLSLAFPDQR